MQYDRVLLGDFSRGRIHIANAICFYLIFKKGEWNSLYDNIIIICIIVWTNIFFVAKFFFPRIIHKFNSSISYSLLMKFRHLFPGGHTQLTVNLTLSVWITIVVFTNVLIQKGKAAVQWSSWQLTIYTCTIISKNHAELNVTQIFERNIATQG